MNTLIIDDSQVRTSMKSFRSTSINKLRAKGTAIFGSQYSEKWFETGYNRADVVEFQKLLGVEDPNCRQYALFPPIFYPDDQKRRRDVFLNPALFKVSTYSIRCPLHNVLIFYRF